MTVSPPKEGDKVSETKVQCAFRRAIPLLACGLLATLTFFLVSNQVTRDVAWALAASVAGLYITILALRPIALWTMDRARQFLGIAEDPTIALQDDTGATSATL